MEVIGNRLQSVQTVYDDAVRKLSSGRGNLIRRAESMRQLGAESSKSLPKAGWKQMRLPLIQSLKIQTTIIRSTNGLGGRRCYRPRVTSGFSKAMGRSFLRDQSLIRHSSDIL